MTDTDDTRPGSAAILAVSIIALMLALAVSAAAWVMMLNSRASFLKMFDEMGVLLPVVTAFALSPLFHCIIPVLALASIIKEPLVRNKTLTTILNGFHLCLIPVIYTIYHQAMMMPMVRLMENMGKSP
ncbi:MAG: hypothetical protein ABIF82_15145 [Planctomycetota bacterium]